MPESMPDFWPNDIGQSNIRTPGSILKEVASYLGPKTKQVVKADVITSANPDGRLFQMFVLGACPRNPV